jgi:urease accessory protein
MLRQRQVRQLFLFFGALLCVSLPSVAIAHVGGHAHAGAGFWQGFSHPLAGIDHQVAMLAVGVWAVQLEDKRARFILPLSFLGLMFIGSIVGMEGMALPGTEFAIIFSDLLLASFIFFGTRLPIVWSGIIIGSLAMFHGYAHGSEIPATAQSFQYMFGFLGGTATLHLIGMGAAILALGRQQANFFRIAGGIMLVASFSVFAQSI